MTLKPCNTCRLCKCCDIRNEIRAGALALRLTSAKFKCAKQRADLPPGAKVLASLDCTHDGHSFSLEGEPRCSPAVLPAVVMGWSREKVRIYCAGSDDAHPYSLRAQGRVDVFCMRPDRLEPTGETVPVCRRCGLPVGTSTLYKWSCGPYQYGEPTDCPASEEPAR